MFAEEFVVIVLIVVMCYVAALALVRRMRTRRGEKLIESITRLILWLLVLLKK
jgi:hypothetical protein